MEKLASKLAGIKTVAIAGHVRPDGDCIGSCMGLYLYLKENEPDIKCDVYLETAKEGFSYIKNLEEAKQEYIKLIDSNSLYKRNVQISPNDHLVILTTCTSDMTNGRNVLVGKITNKTYPEKIKKNKGIGIDILNNNTYLELILILIALIIAVFVKKRKNN